MNLRHKVLILAVVGACGFLGTSFAQGNKPVPANTASKVKPAPVVTLTTDLKPAATPAATNEVKEAKPPGDVFTNSVDMVLLKIGGMWVGKFDVTQQEFQKVMNFNPSQFVGDDHPVESIGYGDALDFCKKLTDLDVQKKELPEGFYYTLPTEGEWQSLVDNASLDSAVTSLNGASRSGTSAVGSLGANSLGLYDIRGNVMEFCLTDDSKPYRVLKGGSWADFVEVNLRPEFRWYSKPDDRKNTFGFRCVLKKK